MNWINLVQSYLAQQRQLGYSLISEGRYLEQFAQFATQQGQQELSVEFALCWANKALSGSSLAITRRFSILRPFSRYLCSLGIGSTILPSHFIGPTHRRLAPFIFTTSDIIKLMTTADKLIPSDGLRSSTIKTLIGLMASTGLRPGEAVRLSRQAVDLNAGTLTIVDSKGWKQRTIPISFSATSALKQYEQQRNQHNPMSQTNAFFEFDDCIPLNIRSADYAFQVIRKASDLSAISNHSAPRLYDLRHTFVCQRFLLWYQAGVDVNQHIAYLSCYLGHKKVSDTYWYLTAIPELMACALNKFTTYCPTGGEA